MRSTIVIEAKDGRYYSTVQGQHGGGHRHARAGLNTESAAINAARLMIDYAASNPEGGDLVAPSEVLARVPEHLHSIPAKS